MGKKKKKASGAGGRADRDTQDRKKPTGEKEAVDKPLEPTTEEGTELECGDDDGDEKLVADPSEGQPGDKGPSGMADQYWCCAGEAILKANHMSRKPSASQIKHVYMQSNSQDLHAYCMVKAKQE